jgi:uncharacterized small protein (DUF1192 family)
MSDPLTLGLASTAVSLVNGTIGFLKEARDAAKRSDDHDLKDGLSAVYDSVLELKEVIGNLRDENAELLKRLQTRAALKWDSRTKLYFAEEDPDPFCPACMDLNGVQIRLQPVLDDGQLWRYDCKVCKNFYIVNSRPKLRSRQIDPGGPWT